MNAWINSEEPSDDAFTGLWWLQANITLSYFLDMYRENFELKPRLQDPNLQRNLGVHISAELEFRKPQNTGTH